MFSTFPSCSHMPRVFYHSARLRFLYLSNIIVAWCQSLALLRWPNTVSVRSAVLCKSWRGFKKAKQTVKCVLTDLHIVCFQTKCFRMKWTWGVAQKIETDNAFAETCRFLTIQSLEFQEIWPKNYGGPKGSITNQFTKTQNNFPKHKSISQSTN